MSVSDKAVQAAVETSYRQNDWADEYNRRFMKRALEAADEVLFSEAAIERAAKAMLDAMYDDKTLKVDDEDRSIIRAVVAALREGA